MLLVFLYRELNLNYFTLTIKMVQNSARLSGLPCALADRWLSRVIRALIRADMINGEPASGPASWALGLSWQGLRLHQLEISLQRTANSHGDAGQWTWFAIVPLRFGHSESMWGFRAIAFPNGDNYPPLAAMPGVELCFENARVSPIYRGWWGPWKGTAI